jgi:hypothetical protein
MQGYKLNGNACDPDISCSKTLNCISCPVGYTLLAYKCQKCSLPVGCAECHSDDPTVCVSCLKGHFLIDGECSSCIIQSCVRCYAQSICQ